MMPDRKFPAILALIVAAMLLALSGCATFDGPLPLRDAVTFQVQIVDDLPTTGRAICTPDGAFCTLQIRRDQYPLCVTHEVRHAFEGRFHDSRPNGENCHDY